MSCPTPVSYTHLSGRQQEPKREEKIFYTNLLTGAILPFPEFIDKALKMGCLNREELEPKGLV